MPNFRLSPLTVVLALSALCSSCWPHRSRKPFTPPPPQTQPQVPSNTPIVVTPPPEIAGDPTSTNPQLPATIPEIAPPPAPKPNVPRPKPAPTTPPRTTTPGPPPDQPPSPRLGQIFSPDEQRQYNRAIDDSLGRVRRALDLLARKNLNADQQAEVARIATFQKQAEQAREAQDLLTAASLAQRADTLAQDLLNRTQ